MKIKIISAIVVCTAVLSCVPGHRFKESLDLSKDWRFQKGDSSVYSSPGFDDRSWQPIKAGEQWESQGFTDYDGVAWYRLHLVFPISLRNDRSLIKSVRISLGKIADSDVAYLNGKRIGSTFGRDTERNYLVPFDTINWDRENILAIRVSNRRGNGGMYSGLYEAGSPRHTDFMSLKTYDKPAGLGPEETSEIKRTLIFNFRIPVEKFKGTVKVKIYDPGSKIVVFEKKESVSAGFNTDTAYNLVAALKKAGSYKIDYYFFSKLFPDTLKCSMLFSYLNTPRINEKHEFPVVNLAVPGKSSPFDLGNLKLDGYLNGRLNANLYQRLLNIDENGILEGYYNRPGKQTWVGEYVGKYLHAASRVWQYSKNEQLKTQMDRIVNVLLACQLDNGYLGTYLPANYWKNWDVWAHKYNLIGLLSYYAATGYKPALETSVKIGDLMCRTFGEGNGQLNIIESSAHVGMASTSILEPMTELYRYTGDKKYLDFCYYILKAYDYKNGPKIISTLTTVGKVDKVANGKAYEMMSNLTGIVKLYQLTHDEKLLLAVENAWKDISRYRLYITGTSSKSELFQDDFVLPAENDDRMGEGCVTTTWLQFSQALFYLTGDPKIIDEIEKTIYNHLLAAENPQTGCVSYYTALQGKKPYRCTINAHCCLASVPRGIAAIPELVHTKNADNGLSINFYSPGNISGIITTKEGKEINLDCTVESGFPGDGLVKITLKPSDKAEFLLALRVPSWSKNFRVNVNGKIYNGVPGTYLNLEQVWDGLTTIQVSFDLNVQFLYGGKSYPGYIAIKTGPQVLAIDQTLNPGIDDLDKIALNCPCKVELTKTTMPAGWIGDQVYTVKGFYDGKQVDLKLVPFADASQTGGDIRVWIKKH